LALLKLNPATGDDLWTLAVESTGSRWEGELFLQTPFHERSPMFSPDGGWIAYQSNESGKCLV
jgi:hypothetical protein